MMKRSLGHKGVILLYEIISSIPLFSGLDRINLAKIIPEMERKSFAAGHIIFNQGDPGDSLFIIINVS